MAACVASADVQVREIHNFYNIECKLEFWTLKLRWARAPLTMVFEVGPKIEKTKRIGSRILNVGLGNSYRIEIGLTEKMHLYFQKPLLALTLLWP